MPIPGEVWFLPPDAGEGGDAKGRRHVLVTRCEDVGDVAVFAYASTKGTEAAFGAAALLVQPPETPFATRARTGFDRATYVYPSRLVAAGPEQMQRKTGRLREELPLLRLLLRNALGIGSRSHSWSWRGTIVTFSAALQAEMDCSHGLVVTEPVYSSRKRYQIVIPVLDTRVFETGGMDLVVAEQDWLPQVFGDSVPVAFAVEMIQTVFHPTEIQGSGCAVVDAPTLAAVDARLVRLFELHDAPPAVFIP